MKKKIIISLLIGNMFMVSIVAKEASLLVNLNEEIASVSTTDKGHKIEIVRIQDTAHRLTDDFSKTSRACPPYCIQPTKVNKNILNISELELFEFITKEVNTNKGILVDTRLKSWFEIESIPSAINIPYTSVVNFSKQKIKKLFATLGTKVFSNGKWDFSNAKKMVIFDNGAWCSQAQYFVDALLSHGYPSNKILYYRAGLQGWKLMGLTTVVHRAEIVE